MSMMTSGNNTRKAKLLMPMDYVDQTVAFHRIVVAALLQRRCKSVAASLQFCYDFGVIDGKKLLGECLSQSLI